MGNRHGRRRAFTLLELLVATAMTAVLAGSLYATLHLAFKARRSAFAAVDQLRKAELAVELLRTDIESAVVPRGVLAGAFIGEDATDGAGHPSDALMLHVAADAAQPTEGTGDIRMVQLICEPSENGDGMFLLRQVTLNLLTTNVEEPTQEVLCRGVRSLDLRYFDGLDWVDAWDSTTRDNVLPLAVEVTLELMHEGDLGSDRDGYRTSRVFQVPCSSIVAGGLLEAAR